jgi:tetratricopeptide (TPR) repeat protein
LELDPDYVPAYTLLALAVMFGQKYPMEEAVRMYGELLRKAIALDPEDGQANAYLGTYRFTRVGWSLDDVRMVEKGIANEPNNAEVMRIAAVFARVIGHFDQAALLAQRAIELDPLCSSCYWILTASYLYGGRLEEAETVSMRRAKLFDWGWQHLATIRLLQGEYEAALETLDSLAEHEQPGSADFAEFRRAFVLHSMGREEEVHEFLSEQGDRRADDPEALAELHAWVGNADASFELLDDVLDPEDPQFRWEWLSNIAWDPIFRGLHDDPRWQAYWAAAETTREDLQAIEFNVNLPQRRQ